MSELRPTSAPVRAYRCLRLVVHFAWISIGAALLYPRVSEAQKARLKQRWSHQILRVLAIRLDLEATDAPPGSLIVANHVSWLDIFVINAMRPSAFVSKSEVRSWPFIGWLAEKNDTVFLRRGSRGHARIVNAEIASLLGRGRQVALFPEGTTTDGSQVHPFHAALLQPAIEAGAPIQPLALCYRLPDGRFTRAPAYDGDVSLLDCLKAIVAEREIVARIHVLPQLATTELPDRKRLSQRARDAIVERIANC